MVDLADFRRLTGLPRRAETLSRRAQPPSAHRLSAALTAQSKFRVGPQNGFALQERFGGKAACDWSGAHHVGPMPRNSTLSPADLPTPSARHLPRVRRGDGWDALADIEVFVFAVEAELEAMERERIGVHRRGRKPDLTLRRRLIGLIWTLTFGGMQWRVAGW